MDLTGSGFTAVGGATSIGFSAKPKGRYVVCLTKSDLEPNSKGDGRIIAMNAHIMQGTLAGSDIMFNINWENPNPKAQEIGRKTLQAICNAVGVLQPANTQQLHNIPFEMEVDVTPDGKYNQLIDVFPLTGGATTPVVQQPTNVTHMPPPPPPAPVTNTPPPPPPAPVNPMELAAKAGWLPNGTSGYFYNSLNTAETQLTEDQLAAKFSAAPSTPVGNTPPPPPAAAMAVADEEPEWIRNQRLAAEQAARG